MKLNDEANNFKSKLSNNLNVLAVKVNEKINNFTLGEKIGSMAIALLLVAFSLFYLSSYLGTLFTTLNNQSKELEAARKRLTQFLDTENSPVSNYLLLKTKKESIERNAKSTQSKGDNAISSIEKLVYKQVGKKNSTIEEGRAQAIDKSIVRVPYKINFRTGSMSDIVAILRTLTDEHDSFKISRLKIEKTYQKFLDVNLEVFNTTRAS
jgi:hypothetical protein